MNLSPEHDDCVDVAAAIRRPVKQVWAAALAAAQALTEDDDGVGR